MGSGEVFLLRIQRALSGWENDSRLSAQTLASSPSFILRKHEKVGGEWRIVESQSLRQVLAGAPPQDSRHRAAVIRLSVDAVSEPKKKQIISHDMDMNQDTPWAMLHRTVCTRCPN